jgi:hypothetical protein
LFAAYSWQFSAQPPRIFVQPESPGGLPRWSAPALVSLVLGRLGAETSPALHFTQIVCLLLFLYIGAVTGATKGELLNLGAFGGVFGTKRTSATTTRFWTPA